MAQKVVGFIKLQIPAGKATAMARLAISYTRWIATEV